ncbi:hypothetical protein BDZ91DRAFT_795708 [Kalaharituber pfeilii]|nr:hypothetical protein BDZ91DRAFT_795708 [Kalaharituber pfeilii]
MNYRHWHILAPAVREALPAAHFKDCAFAIEMGRHLVGKLVQPYSGLTVYSRVSSHSAVNATANAVATNNEAFTYPSDYAKLHCTTIEYPRTHLLSLPPELQQMIVSYLTSYIDTLCLGLTCRSLFAYVALPHLHNLVASALAAPWAGHPIACLPTHRVALTPLDSISLPQGFIDSQVNLQLVHIREDTAVQRRRFVCACHRRPSWWAHHMGFMRGHADMTYKRPMERSILPMPGAAGSRMAEGQPEADSASVVDAFATFPEPTVHITSDMVRCIRAARYLDDTRTFKSKFYRKLGFTAPVTPGTVVLRRKAGAKRKSPVPAPMGATISDPRIPKIKSQVLPQLPRRERTLVTVLLQPDKYLVGDNGSLQRYFPPEETWILRNLDTKEFVSAKMLEESRGPGAFHIPLGVAATCQILWAPQPENRLGALWGP